jgi:hypothetical protein
MIRSRLLAACRQRLLVSAEEKNFLFELGSPGDGRFSNLVVADRSGGQAAFFQTFASMRRELRIHKLTTCITIVLQMENLTVRKFSHRTGRCIGISPGSSSRTPGRIALGRQRGMRTRTPLWNRRRVKRTGIRREMTPEMFIRGKGSR